VDTALFPNMANLTGSLHAGGQRVILWVTSMVDTDSTNYNDLLSAGVYVRDAVDGADPLTWWHGSGLLVDLTNASGQAWYGAQAMNVMPLIDGWKVDGVDPYMLEYLDALDASGAPLSYANYSHAYYGWFYNFSQAHNAEALIMSRPVDSYYLIGEEVSVFLDFSPRYAVFSGWVGDQDPTFEGLEDALTNLMWSAWAGYVGFGSDTGGYRAGTGPLGRTAELLLRWAGVNAFLPLFENGGDDEHRPWIFDQGTNSTFVTDSYRLLVAAHYELQPYLLAQGAAAYASNVSIITPQAPQVPYIELGPGKFALDDISDFSWSLGPDYFVSPVTVSNVTMQLCTLPAGASWSNYWMPNATYGPNATVNVPAPLGQIPVFIRAGALVPLHVSTPYLGHGDASSAGALTLLLHKPRCSADGSAVSIRVAEFQAQDVLASYRCDADGLTLSLSPTPRPVRILLQSETPVDRAHVIVGDSSSQITPSQIPLHPQAPAHARFPAWEPERGYPSLAMEDHVLALAWPSVSHPSDASNAEREAVRAARAANPLPLPTPFWTQHQRFQGLWETTVELGDAAADGPRSVRFRFA
jgi:alpha-glucosidase (family GH31 glycosyl hydrolase)